MTEMLARETGRTGTATGEDEAGPLVSVVVIFLNEERYLGEAVESVLSQTYGQWELLLVDDGSTDGSTALARAYAARDPQRVQYLEHPGHANRGMSASRNAGLYAARGRYVMFLDADDVLTRTALAEQAALLAAHSDAAMAYGPAEWWRSWDRSDPAAEDHRQSLGVRPDRVVPGRELLAAFLLDEGTHPTGPLYRRSALLAVGGLENQFRGMYEDQVLRVKLCLRFSAYVSGQSWYRYRQHPDGACSVAVRQRRHQRARERFLRWVGAYLRAQRVGDRQVWRAQQQALWRCRYIRLLETAQAARTVLSGMGRGALNAQARRVAVPSFIRRERP